MKTSFGVFFVFMRGEKWCFIQQKGQMELKLDIYTKNRYSEGVYFGIALL